MKKLPVFLGLIAIIALISIMTSCVSNHSDVKTSSIGLKQIKKVPEIKVNSVEAEQVSVKFYFGKQKLSAVIIKFKDEFMINSEFMSSEEVLDWMQNNKLRPATLKELKVFGCKTNIAKDVRVVALGSIQKINGQNHVSVLIDNDKNPSIESNLFTLVWNNCYFLAISDSLEKRANPPTV